MMLLLLLLLQLLLELGVQRRRALGHLEGFSVHLVFRLLSERLFEALLGTIEELLCLVGIGV